MPWGVFSTGSCCCSRWVLLPCPGFGSVELGTMASRLLVRLVHGSGAPACNSAAGRPGIVCLLSLTSPLPGAVMLALHRFPYLWQ